MIKDNPTAYCHQRVGEGTLCKVGRLEIPRLKGPSALQRYLAFRDSTACSLSRAYT